MRNVVGMLVALAVLAVQSLHAEEAPAKGKIWLIGDSTVCSYSENKRPLAGWGQMLPLFCKAGVEVANRAVGGRSTKSFIDEKRWEKVLAELKAGDYVMIQFGHNDMKKDKPEMYADVEVAYPDYLKRYIKETREKGAVPVLVTSVCRRNFKEGKLQHTLGNYPKAMREVAASEGVDLIDLNQISYDWFSQLGEEGTLKIFNHLEPEQWAGFAKGSKDNTHFGEYGAAEVARKVVADAVSRKLGVAALLVDDPAAVKVELKPRPELPAAEKPATEPAK